MYDADKQRAKRARRTARKQQALLERLKTIKSTKRTPRDPAQDLWMLSPHAYVQSNRYRRCTCGELLTHRIHTVNT